LCLRPSACRVGGVPPELVREAPIESAAAVRRDAANDLRDLKHPHDVVDERDEEREADRGERDRDRQRELWRTVSL
jgi:hypothetical protein